MKALLIQPGQSLIAAIVSCLGREGKDYSSNLIVFPGKRPGHFLRKAIADEVGESFIPPVIQSMDEFVDSVVDTKAGKARPGIEAIDAVSILYQLHREAAHPIGGEHFMSPDRFFPLGVKIYRDIEELSIEGIPLVKVKEVDTLTGEAIPGPSRERLQSLSYFCEAFYRSIHGRGFSTRSMRYREISERMSEDDLAAFRRVIFAGFFALTDTENKLFEKLLRSEKTIFLFQDGPGVPEKMTKLGITPEAVDKESGELPEIRFYKSPDSHGQIFALSRVLKDQADEDGRLDQKTAIVLPLAETLFPLLHQGLSGLREQDYNVSLGYPLLRTPLFGLLNNLMELVSTMDGDRVYVPTYLAFVLHPYAKNIYFKGNAEITRILFHSLEEELTASRTKTFLSLTEIEQNGRLYEKALERLGPQEEKVTGELLKEHLRYIHENTIGRFLFFRDVKDFAEKSVAILLFLFRQSTGRLHPLFHPFAEAFVRSLEVISRSLMREIRFEETRSYFLLLRKYLSSCYVPFEGTPLRGLQVLGVLETRNLSFDKVYVLDMNEDVIPEGGGEDSLLPFKVRRTLGLPTYIERDQLSAYYFETLWRGAREVHLFSVENDRKETSRFMERLLWLKQKKDSRKDAKRYVETVGYRVSLENRFPEAVKKTETMAEFLKGFSYSATALDVYLRCQILFYYQYVLGIGKKDEVTGGIEKADIGKFVHGVFADYFGKKKGKLLKEKDIDIGEMSFLVERRFEQEYGKDPVGAAYLLKRQVREHLVDFLKDYTVPLIRDVAVTVLEVEQTVRTVKNGFRLKGRLDHVEKRGDKVAIIDYKTSADPGRLKIRFDRLDPESRETWGEAIGSVQLPFYLLLYSEATGRPIKEIEGMFLLLGKKVLNRGIEHPLYNGQDDPEGLFDGLVRVIFSMLREVVDPGLPFLPASDLKTGCPNCDFRNLCGTQWVI